MPETRHTKSPLYELTIYRLKEFVREPDAVFWVLIFPLLLTLALGFAFREKPPDRIPVGVSEGPFAQRHLTALKKSPALQPRLYPEREGREELRRGNISLLVDGGQQPVYRFDPTRPESRAARVEVDNALQASAGRRNAFAAKEEHVTEQGSRYIDFLVPGLIAMNLMGTGMWSISFAVVNARLKKLLKRFLATPMRKSTFLTAQFLSRLVFLVVEVAVVAIFAWLVFDVEIRGPVALFCLLCLLGGAAFAGIGILVSSRAKTLEAVSGLMNLVMMPMWICSGVFFSYERFPDAVKPIIRALPLTALADALRAVMNDGFGTAAVMPQIINLVAWTLVSFVVGLKIFRWS
ncbi:MAG TPA: ABC transporter permease [Thermoanaerobaculia bacterium]|jgi:ABC-type multidrug transport system permease subunit|nr:ABC transporter permease [Thermoanaerobaculia bacterium]